MIMNGEIPIVDLGKLTGLQTSKDVISDTNIMKQVAGELDTAFSTVGFVYLKNHGIPQFKIDEMFSASRTFFQLPVAEKFLVKRELNKNDGYVGQNQELLDSRNRSEIREAYNSTSKENQLFLDDRVPEFRKAIDDLVPHLCSLTRLLLKCLEVALGLEENFFLDKHKFMYGGAGKNATTFRSLYYPSLSDIPDSELSAPGVVRCGEHSDYGTITLLMQDELGGLEVLSGGQWVPAIPLKGAILVNLGDLMQFWTSDRYLATVHRVLVPEEEIRRKAHRQSVVLFVHPDNDVMVNPLLNKNAGNNDNKKGVNALDYLKQRLSASYKF